MNRCYQVISSSLFWANPPMMVTSPAAVSSSKCSIVTSSSMNGPLHWGIPQSNAAYIQYVSIYASLLEPLHAACCASRTIFGYSLVIISFILVEPKRLVLTHNFGWTRSNQLMSRIETAGVNKCYRSLAFKNI